MRTPASRRWAWRRTAGACAGLVVLSGALGARALLPPGSSSSALCWVSPRSYLTSADIYHQTHWKFTHWLTFRYTAFPIHDNPLFPPPLVAADFEAGRTEGFLVNLSLSGAFRRQNNAKARRLHYPIGRWPYVPLMGPIVRGHPGSVLEVYEDNFAWRSLRGA